MKKDTFFGIFGINKCRHLLIGVNNLIETAYFKNVWND
jgi:hypothetical protein